MIALVFLYWTACIFVYGAELNAAIGRFRDGNPDAGPTAHRDGESGGA